MRAFQIDPTRVRYLPIFGTFSIYLLSILFTLWRHYSRKSPNESWIVIRRKHKQVKKLDSVQVHNQVLVTERIRLHKDKIHEHNVAYKNGGFVFQVVT